MQLFVIFLRQRRTSAKCNFYCSNNRSVLVPSSCTFHAIVWAIIFLRQRRTSAKCNFYCSNNRSVLVPSSCTFHAIVWAKEETKMLNSANCRWEFSEECLADAWILQRKCSPLHYLSPLPFHYPHLSPLHIPKEISTIDYY